MAKLFFVRMLQMYKIIHCPSKKESCHFDLNQQIDLGLLQLVRSASQQVPECTE